MVNELKNVMVCFKCDENIITEFRKLAVQKHGKLRGALEPEFSDAIKAHNVRLREELKNTQ